MNKTMAEQVHFAKKCIERFGAIPNKSEIVQMISQIKKGSSQLVKKQTLTKSLHAVSFRGESVLVVYNKTRKQLVTILPKTDKRYNTLLVKNKEAILKEGGTSSAG